MKKDKKINWIIGILTIIVLLQIINITLIMKERNIGENFKEHNNENISNIMQKYNGCEPFEITIKNATFQVISKECSFNKSQEYYKKGLQKGFEIAVLKILENAKRCKPFSVFYYNQTRYLINYECLTSNNSTE